MCRGFSLTEVMLAMLLAALTITCLVTVLIGGVRLLESSQEVTEATSIGRDLMEATAADPALTEGVRAGVRQGKFAYATRVEVTRLDDWRTGVVVEVHWKQRASLRLATVLRR